MKVKDLMTKSVACVRVNEGCDTAAQLMWNCDCGAIPVLDESGERVVGMITDRDICMAAWSKNCPPVSIPVSQAMSREIHCCEGEDSLASAEEVMRTKQIRRMPVLDSSRRLIGILSLADIARNAQAGNRFAKRSDIAPDEVASTLANICRPPAQNEDGRARA